MIAYCSRSWNKTKEHNLKKRKVIYFLFFIEHSEKMVGLNFCIHVSTVTSPRVVLWSTRQEQGDQSRLSSHVITMCWFCLFLISGPGDLLGGPQPQQPSARQWLRGNGPTDATVSFWRMPLFFVWHVRKRSILERWSGFIQVRKNWKSERKSENVFPVTRKSGNIDHLPIVRKVRKYRLFTNCQESQEMWTFLGRK